VSNFLNGRRKYTDFIIAIPEEVSYILLLSMSTLRRRFFIYFEMAKIKSAFLRRDALIPFLKAKSSLKTQI